MAKCRVKGGNVRCCKEVCCFHRQSVQHRADDRLVWRDKADRHEAFVSGIAASQDSWRDIRCKSFEHQPLDRGPVLSRGEIHRGKIGKTKLTARFSKEVLQLFSAA